MSDAKDVILLGASGLVGGHVLELLLADPKVNRVRAIVRTPLQRTAKKLEQSILNFEEISNAPHLLRGDVIVCALGTTIGKAGSEAAFRTVDHDYPLLAARLGQDQGVKHFLLVSSLGADSGSRIFYNRVKGEIEAALERLAFERLTLVRPSLLLGDRAEFRFGERIFQVLGKLIPGKYRPVHARQVAAALVDRLHQGPGGVEILESSRIRAEF